MNAAADDEPIVRPGRLEDAEAVAQLGRSSIGEAHSTAGLIQARLAVSEDVLRVALCEESDERPRICGYTLAYPLNRAGTDRIAGGRILKGGDIELTDLASDLDTASGLYWGMILGVDRRAKRAVKRSAARDLARFFSGPRGGVLYARAASVAGQRLMDKLGFERWGEQGLATLDSATAATRLAGLEF